MAKAKPGLPRMRGELTRGVSCRGCSRPFRQSRWHRGPEHAPERGRDRATQSEATRKGAVTYQRSLTLT